MTSRTPREVIAISNCGLTHPIICTDGICERCIDYADQHVAALTDAGYKIIPLNESVSNLKQAMVQSIQEWATAAEREACAKVVEEMFGGSRRGFAAAIRARGKEK